MMASSSSGMTPNAMFKKAKEFRLGYAVDSTLPIEDYRQLSKPACHLKDDPSIVTIQNVPRAEELIETKTTHKLMGVDAQVGIQPSIIPISVSALAGISLERTSNQATRKMVVYECRIDLSGANFQEGKSFESTIKEWIQKQSHKLTTIAIRAAKECKVEVSALDIDSVDLRKRIKDHAEWSVETMDLAITLAQIFHLQNDAEELTDARICEVLLPHNMKSENQDMVESWYLLWKLCKEYIQEHHITHYVSGLIVGAAMDEVVGQTQERRQFHVGGSMSPSELPVEASAKVKAQKAIESGFMRKQTVGILHKTDDGYEISSSGVLAYILKPITELVLDNFLLRDAVQTALVKYVDQYKHPIKFGPFILSASLKKGADSIDCFLKINRGTSELVGTTRREEASAFHFGMVNQSNHEVYIMHYKDLKRKHGCCIINSFAPPIFLRACSSFNTLQVFSWNIASSCDGTPHFTQDEDNLCIFKLEEQLPDDKETSAEVFQEITQCKRAFYICVYKHQQKAYITITDALLDYSSRCSTNIADKTLFRCRPILPMVKCEIDESVIPPEIDDSEPFYPDPHKLHLYH